MLFRSPKGDNLPSDIYEGQVLEGMNGEDKINVFVNEIKEDSVILDANHPLAGQTLEFDIELVEIVEAVV